MSSMGTSSSSDDFAAAQGQDWTPPRAGGMVRGFREIAGPTRHTATWEAKALECLYALASLAEDDPTREDYHCAANVYALLEVAESVRGESHDRKPVGA